MNATGEDRVLTIPNVISAARILGVGWFLWLLLGVGDVALAAVVLIVIGSTDWVDGYLARRLGQTTEFGRMLDPVADRLALVAAVVGGYLAEVDGARVLPGWLVVGLLSREVVMAVTVAWMARRTGTTLQVRWAGKLATFLLYGAIPSLYLGAALAPSGWATSLRWVGLVTGAVGLAVYVWVAAGYVGEARRAVAAAKGERSSGAGP